MGLQIAVSSCAVNSYFRLRVKKTPSSPGDIKNVLSRGRVCIFQVAIFWEGIFHGAIEQTGSLISEGFPGGSCVGGTFPRTNSNLVLLLTEFL